MITRITFDSFAKDNQSFVEQYNINMKRACNSQFRIQNFSSFKISKERTGLFDKWGVYLHPEGKVVCFAGEITHSFAERLRFSLNKFVHPTHIVLLSLNSLGGMVSGTKMALLEMQKLKKLGVKIHTHVPENAACASACLEIFLAGDIKTAGKNAKFGFHAASHMGTGELLKDDTEFYINRLEELTSKTTMDVLRKEMLFAETAFKVKSPHELMELTGSKFIDMIVDDRDLNGVLNNKIDKEAFYSRLED